MHKVSPVRRSSPIAINPQRRVPEEIDFDPQTIATAFVRSERVKSKAQIRRGTGILPVLAGVIGSPQDESVRFATGRIRLTGGLAAKTPMPRESRVLSNRSRSRRFNAATLQPSTQIICFHHRYPRRVVLPAQDRGVVTHRHRHGHTCSYGYANSYSNRKTRSGLEHLHAPARGHRG